MGIDMRSAAVCSDMRSAAGMVIWKIRVVHDAVCPLPDALARGAGVEHGVEIALTHRVDHAFVSLDKLCVA